MQSKTLQSTVLVVDDEKNIRRTLRMVLESEGHEVEDAASVADAVAAIRGKPHVNAVFLDVQLGADSGMSLLEMLRDGSVTDGAAQVPVIMISGHATIDDAVQATRLGAFDFLEKPLERNRVVVSARNAIERSKILLQVSSLRSAVDSKFEILGSSSVIESLRSQILKVAPTRTRVLITGESGTGKELVARAIHRNSAVADGPFVKVNCAAIPPELIESELFGHERGAFTGAVKQKRGLFEAAENGSIFLDEIGDMSLSAQAKVLRVLQSGDFSRVGGETTRMTNARVVAATNKNLEAEVAEGSFREDLFFRLNVVPIHSPPLRERKGDIPLLLEAFIAECCEENGFAHKEVDEQVLGRLKQYEWPGNVRELRNIVERLVVLSDEMVREHDLPPHLVESERPRFATNDPSGPDFAAFADRSLREFRDTMESQFIRYRLEEFDWNISRTAQALGIERTNLHKKLRSLGIERP